MGGTEKLVYKPLSDLNQNQVVSVEFLSEFDDIEVILDPILYDLIRERDRDIRLSKFFGTLGFLMMFIGFTSVVYLNW